MMARVPVEPSPGRPTSEDSRIHRVLERQGSYRQDDLSEIIGLEGIERVEEAAHVPVRREAVPEKQPVLY